MIRDRYVEVPAEMTAPVEIVTLGPRAELESMTTEERLFHVEAARKAQTVRALQCNGQLAEIAGLGNE